MAINISESLTTGVNWQWREAGVHQLESNIGTVAVGTTTNKTFTVRHNALIPVVITGFYLAPIEDMGDYRPFLDKEDQVPSFDVDEALRWGDVFSSGLYVVQNAVATLFKNGTGSSLTNLLPFTLATNLGGGQVEPGEILTIGLRLITPSAVQLQSARTMNFNVRTAYRKVPA